MILEHSILAILYLLGVAYQVMQEIGKLRLKYPEFRPSQLFSTYWRQEWNTLIVSFLGLITTQLTGYILHYKNVPLPAWLHDYGVYPLMLLAGWAWHRLVYKWLGTTEAKINAHLESMSMTFAGNENDDRDFVQYPSKDDFPVPGAANTVYLDASTDICYVWDAGHSVYKVEGDRPTKPPRIP